MHKYFTAAGDHTQGAESPWSHATKIIGAKQPHGGSLHAEHMWKRGSASYIVREVLSVRERERERERAREKTIGNRKRDCA